MRGPHLARDGGRLILCAGCCDIRDVGNTARLRLRAGGCYAQIKRILIMTKLCVFQQVALLIKPQARANPVRDAAGERRPDELDGRLCLPFCLPH